MVLTRQDVHEDGGDLVDEQRGRMVGSGQQQEEDDGRGAGQGQGCSGPEEICKPAVERQSPHATRFLTRSLMSACELHNAVHITVFFFSFKCFVLAFQTSDRQRAERRPPWFANSRTTECQSLVSLPNTTQRHDENTDIKTCTIVLSMLMYSQRI